MTDRTRERSSITSAIARSRARCATQRLRRIGSRGSGRTEDAHSLYNGHRKRWLVMTAALIAAPPTIASNIDDIPGKFMTDQ